MADQPAQRGHDPAQESGWGSPMPAEYGSLTTFLPPLDETPEPGANERDHEAGSDGRSPERPPAPRRPERPGAARRPERRWWVRKAAPVADSPEHPSNGAAPGGSPAPVWAPPAGAGGGAGAAGAASVVPAHSDGLGGDTGSVGVVPGAPAQPHGRGDGNGAVTAGVAGADAAAVTALSPAVSSGAEGAEGGDGRMAGPGAVGGLAAAGAAAAAAAAVNSGRADRNGPGRGASSPQITRDPLPASALTTVMPVPSGPMGPPVQPQAAPDQPRREQTRGSFGSRRRQRKAARAQWAQSKRTVRHLNVWTVFKVSLAFYFMVLVAVVVASIMLWYVANAFGSIQTIEKSVKTLFDLSKFTIHPSEVERYTAIGGGVLAVCGTFANVLAAFMYNLISDLVGGIRFDVVDEGR